MTWKWSQILTVMFHQSEISSKSSDITSKFTQFGQCFSFFPPLITQGSYWLPANKNRTALILGLPQKLTWLKLQ